MLYRPLFSSISLRMRKLFIATLLLTIGCGTPAFAADCEDKNVEQCPSTPGCYWEGSAQACNQCKANTYNDGTISADSHCYTCSSLSNYVAWIGTKLGLTSDTECEFKKTCPPYTYFVDHTKENCAPCSALNDSQNNEYYYGTKTTEYEVTGTIKNSTSNFNDACATCGENSITKDDQGTGCRCIDGYHVSGKTNGDTINNGTDCVPNQYTITYIANNGTNDTEAQPVQYSTTVSTLSASTFERKGYKLSKWENKDKKLQIEPGNSFTYEILGNLELTAAWTGKEFTVTYDVGDANCDNLSDQTCRYNEGCRNESNIYRGGAQDVKSCKYQGYVFRGWKCTSGCENNNETIDPGANISTKSGGENMTLTAIWEQCPAGYYCLINSPKTSEKCPAGSTSDAGSVQIDDCHMTGGTTKICDKNNDCFTLPAAVGNIFYHGTQQ